MKLFQILDYPLAKRPRQNKSTQEGILKVELANDLRASQANET
jgi:hypothetical protein